MTACKMTYRGLLQSDFTTETFEMSSNIVLTRH